MNNDKTDVVIIGAGLAGITTALELLDSGFAITLVDGSSGQALGGQANEAFGGMLLINTPEQSRNRIQDSPELLLEDWLTAARFGDGDRWGRAWASLYAEKNRSMIYDWLHDRGIRFVPSVQWVERGLYGDGNRRPRYHIAWGCGRGVVQTLIRQLEQHPSRDRLTILRNHRVQTLTQDAGGVTGCRGQTEDGKPFEITADNTVVCTGGINGNLEKVREHWDACYGPAPENLLAGSSPDADGALHDQVDAIGGQVVNLHWMWNYAAGVRHPQPQFEHHGLSLIPPRSALWMDCYGRRIGPMPLVTGFDTHDLCKQIGHLPNQYSWQVMNRRIAVRELAVSGTDSNPDFRDGKLLKVVWHALRGGNPALMDWLIAECPDVVVADTPEQLAQAMAGVDGTVPVDTAGMIADLQAWDDQLACSSRLANDDQIRRLQHLHQWGPDKLRTCNLQPILDPKAGPLIAIREQLISRKSMGGIRTDLESRVLDASDQPIPGLYAAGEAAGFGGGGISGIRSLEGTFLSNCILNGRRAAQSISGRL
ncbi:FAD-dependent oxidoreductase [Marinobacter oulmenensis]|uniref:FAD-dependent oxidoreductase 2 FAD-binding domain-containing protein n=1 Tax=Marinobacter oulmenensis TaxID=643747 RepID=A0A840UC88_9GAMM|nr:FAD-dependent oxidoreductase [Marinobacter oulmenensis]MBB5320095.1 hypothetical protein [Marinobacter oulmenensis]